mmetsp:Transcript_58357/g.92663  ORF Transcript_58357/g.92663 Transcript_58357/m.92663 type:complete len:301 (-) Transcript_58357:605-1507(-)
MLGSCDLRNSAVTAGRICSPRSSPKTVESMAYVFQFTTSHNLISTRSRNGINQRSPPASFPLVVAEELFFHRFTGAYNCSATNCAPAFFPLGKTSLRKHFWIKNRRPLVSILQTISDTPPDAGGNHVPLFSSRRFDLTTRVVHSSITATTSPSFLAMFCDRTSPDPIYLMQPSNCVPNSSCRISSYFTFLATRATTLGNSFNFEIRSLLSRSSNACSRSSGATDEFKSAGSDSGGTIVKVFCNQACILSLDPTSFVRSPAVVFVHWNQNASSHCESPMRMCIFMHAACDPAACSSKTART